MSFVPNVASIEMAPLWPYDRMDSHGVGEWDLSPNDFTNILEKKHILRMLENPRPIEIARLVCKHQHPLLCFKSKYAMF